MSIGIEEVKTEIVGSWVRMSIGIEWVKTKKVGSWVGMKCFRRKALKNEYWH